jgi:RNA polymerase sigma-70 factor (ECF subfamily)
MFHSWFFRIVVNDALKEAKRQKRTISLDKPADKVLDWMLSSVPNPEEMTELNELRQDVWHAIQWLSPEQRTVIVQRHFLEMNEAEMSHTLRRPPSTIKWWLHTARKRLKSLLATKRINL